MHLCAYIFFKFVLTATVSSVLPPAAATAYTRLNVNKRVTQSQAQRSVCSSVICVSVLLLSAALDSRRSFCSTSCEIATLSGATSVSVAADSGEQAVIARAHDGNEPDADESIIIISGSLLKWSRGSSQFIHVYCIPFS